MTSVSVKLPAKVLPVFTPARGDVRYRCLYGGRGSSKSFSAAKMAAIWASMETLRVLCTREFQASIRESFHAELRNAINSEPWLAADYDIGVEYIRHKKTGSEFFFRGLRNNIASIKSMAQIDLTIVEEAEDIPEDSWQALLATIFRTDKSELWAVWNPRVDGSPVDKRFRKNPPDKCVIAEVNWSDNPWFPPALEELRKHEQKTLDPSTYSNIWEGEYLTRTDAQVFAGKFRTEEFTPNPKWDGPYCGADWGFAKDPSTGVLVWKNGQTLYVEKEYYGAGVELDKLGGELLAKIPEFANHAVRGDSARPDLISYLSRPISQSGGSGQIPRLVGVKKGAGSIEDGVEFIKSHEVIIHPRCTNTLKEFKLYSYKTDRLSGDILPVIVDDWNHCIAEGQRVLTNRGLVPIESVTTSDKVMTRGGMQNVLFSGMTDTNRQVLKVETTIGTVICTPDHKVWTNRGFVRADALRYDDEVIGDSLWQKQPNGTGKHIDDGRNQNVDLIGRTFNGQSMVESSTYIGQYIYQRAIKFLKDTTSIIGMAIRPTTLWKTLSAYLQRITLDNTLGVMSEKKSKPYISQRYVISQRSGTPVQKEGSFIEGLGAWLTKTSYQYLSLASNVRKNLAQDNLEIKTCSVATHASLHTVGRQASMTSQECANSVGMHSQSINIKRHSAVAGRVLDITQHGVATRVYDLTVENNHEFFVEGVLVHNCIDAVRYALEPVMKNSSFDWGAL